MNVPTGLSFDDVLLVPHPHSTVRSRSHPDTGVDLDRISRRLRTPIIASPMDTVTGLEMLRRMTAAGGLAILHRYMSIEEQVEILDAAFDRNKLFDQPTLGAAIGSKAEDMKRLSAIAPYIEVVCIDVANGNHVAAVEQVHRVREVYPNIHIMAGNVATEGAFHRLDMAGADSIRVGIGPGSACSTRTMTGMGVPQLTAIMDCDYSERRAALIADGGIRSPGDLCKAIAAGADAVMLGGVLAGTDASPGEVMQGPEGKQLKQFRGMASAGAQLDRGTEGNVVPEGIEGHVEYSGTLEDTILMYDGGLRSSMSYVDALTLTEYRRGTSFIKITPGGLRESNPHDVIGS